MSRIVFFCVAVLGVFVPMRVFAQVKPARGFEAWAVSPTELRFAWLPAPNATGYRLEVEGALEANLPTTATEFRLDRLKPGTPYHCRLTTLGQTAPNTNATVEYDERTFTEFPSAKLNPKDKIPGVNYDVVVVQASSGGVSAAIEAARRGLRVALVEPTTRLGGMPVNGLSATDIRRSQLYLSGFLVRFRDKVKALYAHDDGLTNENGLAYEPRVAHKAMKSLIYAEPNITVYRRTRLAKVNVKTSADGRRRVESVVMEELNSDGEPTGKQAVFRAPWFIDSTDSGDLAAWAGAPFRVGREPRSQREPHNGVIYYDRAGDKLLPGSTGKGDRRMQSYAYLFAVKDYGKNADKTIPKPNGYKRENFIHTPEWNKSWAVTSGKMPNDKYEINQHPQGSDRQEVNYRYPTADYKHRAEVEKQYREQVMQYLYYIQTEQGQKQLGLPDDEYRDTGGFPPLLYVREGRRILGEQLPDEWEIANARQMVRPEVFGIGDYPMDSHAVRTKTDWNSPDMGEGEWWLYRQTPWHPLPLGVIVPQRLDNVFVTTAVSSTHVSYGTYRMEPVRMQFGQAAGIGAALCLRYGLTGRELPARQIQMELLPHPANLFGDPIVLHHFPDLKPDNPDYFMIQFMAARGFLPDGENFAPDAPTIYTEMGRWLNRIADRGVSRNGESPVYDSLHGRSVMDFFVRKDLRGIRTGFFDYEMTDRVSRAEFARWLVQLVPPVDGEILTPSRDYADLNGVRPDQRNAILELSKRGLTSILFDGADAFTPDGKLLFKPHEPIAHAQAFRLLYLVQISLGYSFSDSPIDFRNGRRKP